MKHRLLPRILISLLGLALILWGFSSIALGIFGKQAPAFITSVRREGGERTDGRPGRYTYNIAYTFTMPDGRKIDGFTKDIGTSVFMKADGTSVTSVKYFEKAPFINSLEKDTKLTLGQPVLIAVGLFLIFMMNREIVESIFKKR